MSCSSVEIVNMSLDKLKKLTSKLGSLHIYSKHSFPDLHSQRARNTFCPGKLYRLHVIPDAVGLYRDS